MSSRKLAFTAGLLFLVGCSAPFMNGAAEPVLDDSRAGLPLRGGSRVYEATAREPGKAIVTHVSVTVMLAGMAALPVVITADHLEDEKIDWEPAYAALGPATGLGLIGALLAEFMLPTYVDERYATTSDPTARDPATSSSTKVATQHQRPVPLRWTW